MSRNDAFDGWTDRADDAYRGYLRQCSSAFGRAADALDEAREGGWVQRASVYNRAALGLALDMASSWMDLGTRVWGLPSTPVAESPEKRPKKKK